LAPTASSALSTVATSASLMRVPICRRKTLALQERFVV
jgi:hypothetical protein